MVRRSHVVPGSIACCPWWTLGGSALVAVAAVTLSGSPVRRAAGPEFDARTSPGGAVFAAEREDGEEEGDAAVRDGEGGGARLPLDVPLGGDDNRTPGTEPVDVGGSSHPESVSATLPVKNTGLLDGQELAPTAN